MGVTAYRLVTERSPLPETDSEEAEDDLHLPFPPLKPTEELVNISPQLGRPSKQAMSGPSLQGASSRHELNRASLSATLALST
jgi:hypothetical protein